MNRKKTREFGTINEIEQYRRVESVSRARRYAKKVQLFILDGIQLSGVSRSEKLFAHALAASPSSGGNRKWSDKKYAFVRKTTKSKMELFYLIFCVFLFLSLFCLTLELFPFVQFSGRLLLRQKKKIEEKFASNTASCAHKTHWSTENNENIH